jgi:hypothetical protein
LWRFRGGSRLSFRLHLLSRGARDAALLVGEARNFVLQGRIAAEELVKQRSDWHGAAAKPLEQSALFHILKATADRSDRSSQRSAQAFNRDGTCVLKPAENEFLSCNQSICPICHGGSIANDRNSQIR